MIFYFYFLEELQKIEGISICGFFFFFQIRNMRVSKLNFFFNIKVKDMNRGLFSLQNSISPEKEVNK